MRHDQVYRELGQRYLGGSVTGKDGVPEEQVILAESRLGFALPCALRDYYLVLGAVPKLNRVHNRLLAPSELQPEEGFLVFLEENQGVVSWGIPLSIIAEEDPVVWQRTNTPPFRWLSEEKTFVAFLESMFTWYAEGGVLP
ncbi:MAG: hypothetical protein U0166_10565 [Acidobacteriota bacterium]